ncbi:hypothetical protein, partial [Arcobacter sp. CECT 8985]|uniref:hypothetical protein n=1 Tax=Arcobacter sp. CECT 8985 TaxID=1935424 RepID=UPI00102691E9
MNKLIKISTFIILTVCIVLLFTSKSLDNISNNILTILPSSKEKSLLLNYDKLKASKTIIVSTKGLDENSYKNIKKIDKELSNIKYLSLKQNNSNNFKNEYLKKYHLYLNKMNEHKIKSLNIQNELSNLYSSLTNSFFPIIINNKDPFNLFENIKTNSALDIKNSHLIIKDYGYISFFDIDKKANSLKQYKQIYNEISKIKKRFNNTTIFSPIFYYVENQKAIKNDVNKIVIVATIILFILYIFMIKNFSLLFHTVSALATSIILSIIILSLFFNNISIFTLVFGISISTVAIDYMFHLYMNDYYVKNKSFNKEVFFGFLTTIIAFFIISFTSFDLIKQISIFAMSTLFISYLQFSILFPKIGFTRKKEFEIKINLFKIKPIY